jgi:amidase
LGAVLGEDMPPATIRAMERMRGWARWQMGRGAGPTSNAAMTLAYTATHREWMAADAVRARLRHEIGEVFTRFDAILAPITPVTAFAHDHRPFGERQIIIDGAPSPYGGLPLWSSIPTPTGNPATAMPIGLDDAGLPIGMQIIGPFLADHTTIAFAGLVEREFGGFVAPPGC